MLSSETVRTCADPIPIYTHDEFRVFLAEANNGEFDDLVSNPDVRTMGGKPCRAEGVSAGATLGHERQT